MACIFLGSVGLLAQDKAALEAQWQNSFRQGVAAYERGDYAQAEQSLNSAVEVAKKIGNEEHIAMSLYKLTGVYRELGKYTQGEDAAKQSLSIAERLHAPGRVVASILSELGTLCMYHGLFSDAEAAYVRALRIRESDPATTDRELAVSLNDLGSFYRRTERPRPAVPLLERAAKLSEKAGGAESADFASTLENLAIAYRHTGQQQMAEPLYARVLAIRENLYGPNHPRVGLSLDNMAVFYASEGKYKEAEQYSRRSVEIFEKAPLGPDHPDLVKALENRAEILKHLGQKAEAAVLRDRAQQMRARHSQANPQH
ncbi:MAG: tetratricopeptide repeat protein [Acidobacteriia bacterium]|nr:tetratricopeptide repeat protein [Terriglobia bacterium]